MAKVSDETKLAVFGERLAQIKATVDDVSKDVKDIKNARYVTQTDLTSAIADSEKKQGENLSDLKKDIDSIKKTLWGIAASVLLTVLGAVLKLVLKI